MTILEDPCISLIEERITNETEELVKAVNDTSNDLKANAEEKRKELSSKLMQYCIAKQAASKFQVNPNSRRVCRGL